MERYTYINRSFGETTQGRIKVLVLDERAEFRTLCREHLPGDEIDLCEATDSPERAMEVLQKEEPDVMILDIVLRSTDGIAFIQALSRLELKRSPIIIVTSSVTNEFFVKQCLDAGAAYFLAKPVNLHLLAERIKALFASRHERHADSELKLIHKRRYAEETLEMQVTDTLLEMGIPAHIKGYQYIRAAILLVCREPDAINGITKIIYPTLAREFGTTSSRVERAIRHAIEVAWDRGNVDLLQKTFGYSISIHRGKPTNSEFIALLSDKLRLSRSAETPIKQTV